MAFPKVEWATVTEFLDAPRTNHYVYMPTPVDAGDLLLAVVFNTGTATITDPGWTEISTRTTSDNSARLTVLAAAVSAGFPALPINFQTSSPEYAIVHFYRISGWFGDIAGVEAVLAASNSVWPSATTLSPSWGSAYTLWLAVAAKTAGTVTGPPPNFTYFLSGPSQLMGSARRELVAASLTPGSFLGETTARWVSATIGVRPDPTVEGVGAADLPAVTGEGDGQAIIEGSGAATLPAAGAAGSATALVDGFGQAVLPAYAGEGSGAALVDGSGEAALPGIVAEGVGGVVDADTTEILWDGTPVTWDGQQAHWGEPTAIVGAGEATIPPLTAQGSGAALVDGSGEAFLPAYTGEGAGATLIEGVGESALPAIAASGAGTVHAPEIAGFGEATFAAFVADGVGVVLVIGSGEATVPALAAAGYGFQGEPPEHRAGSEQTVLRRRGFSTTALRS